MAVDPTPTENLIAGRYAVDVNRRLLEAGGGMPAFAVTDRRSGDARLIALAVDRYAAPRKAALQGLLAPIDNLMTPLAHGIAPRSGGGQQYYIICPAPPGPPVSASLMPWPEAMLLEHVLRPAAQALAALQDAGLTHRAIRPDNVFCAARGQPITLGAAWGEPPGMRQTAASESPFSAMCHPAGRGDGLIADDVYALGVLLVAMVTGQLPMGGQDDATIIRRKLDLGSYAALTAGAFIPPMLSDLLRGMLADEPEHRPAPRLLMDPANARTRRIASRPPRRSQRPLMLNDIPVLDSRTLAYALSTDDRKSIQALRNGVVSHWLRRGLGDAGLAALIEELVRVRMADPRADPDADPRLVMNAISTISPNMPLCWRDVALSPDGIADLLAHGIQGNSHVLTIVEELIAGDIMTTWSTDQPTRRADVLSASSEGRQLRGYLQKGGEGALLRLFYALNPLLPCGVQATADLWILDLTGLMQHLERMAAAGPHAHLLDVHLRAFIAARGDRQIETALGVLIGTRDSQTYKIRQLALLRDMQQRCLLQPLPALAAWAAAQIRPDLESWRNQIKRAERLERLEALAKGGFLARLLALAEDNKARAQDEAGARHAELMVAAIDGELAAIDRSDRIRGAAMGRLGREVAAATGMIALVLMSLVAAFG